MNVIAVIPARFESTRLPGKPLKIIGGKTLIRRVYENARNSRQINDLIVATDDERIVREVKSCGGKAVMTPTELHSGTDRVAFIAKDIDANIIVNIQGDELFLSPLVIDSAIRILIENQDCVVSTVGRTGITEQELNDPNVVKVLINRRNEAIYFSRQNIPFIRLKNQVIANHPALVHVGLYVYRRDFLLEFIQMPVSVLENLEKLEQLRILENGYTIRVVPTEHASLGIDTPEDLAEAEEMVKHGC